MEDTHARSCMRLMVEGSCTVKVLRTIRTFYMHTLSTDQITTILINHDSCNAFQGKTNERYFLTSNEALLPRELTAPGYDKVVYNQIGLHRSNFRLIYLLSIFVIPCIFVMFLSSSHCMMIVDKGTVVDLTILAPISYLLSPEYILGLYVYRYLSPYTCRIIIHINIEYKQDWYMKI